MSLLKYTVPAYATRILILFIDFSLACISVILASLLRFNWDLSKILPELYIFIFTVILIRLLTFRWFRSYAVVVRYSGISDVLQVFKAIFGGSLLLFSLSITLSYFDIIFPKSIIVIDFFLLTCFLAAFRLLMPSLFYLFFDRNSITKEKVIIVGAGQLGAITRNVIRKDANSNFIISAIIDDNPDLENKYLDGIPLLNTKHLKEFIAVEAIDKAIFSIQNISVERKNEIVDLLLDNQIKVLQVPFKSTWLNEDFKLDQLEDIEIEDLLDRPSINLENSRLKEEIEGEVILVSGGAGSIGSELVAQLVHYKPKKLIVIDQAESPLVELVLKCKEDFGFTDIFGIVADVTNKERINHIIESYRPKFVYHAAAYKHVPIMELHPHEAVDVNVLGTMNVSEASVKFGVSKFIMVSTDKAVNPTNVMGATKRAAEIFIQALNGKTKTQFITTRFGNVLGSNGSVVPRFKSQIKKGGPITVTHKSITRYFMTIPEASQLVLEASVMGTGGEIFLFDMGEPVRIYDLAERMIKLSGLKPNHDIKIEIVGLRPGEKIYEELLANEENSMPTHHPKIMIAKIRNQNFEEVSNVFQAFRSLVLNPNRNKLVSKLKEVVPEFKSENSEFSSLDKNVKISN